MLPTPEETAHYVKETKTLRRDLDEQLQKLKHGTGEEGAPVVRLSNERRIAGERLTEAIMWLGMDLKALDTPDPYPESRNPESSKIEPTADGLKL